MRIDLGYLKDCGYKVSVLKDEIFIEPKQVANGLYEHITGVLADHDVPPRVAGEQTEIFLEAIANEMIIFHIKEGNRQ